MAKPVKDRSHEPAPKSLRINAEDWELLTRAAQATGIPRNRLIVQASKQWAQIALSVANKVSADNARLGPQFGGNSTAEAGGFSPNLRGEAEAQSPHGAENRQAKQAGFSA